ncbi:MAG TPA: PQQ-binding-like beta-propeller repeat protein, partial [Gemmatimonadales bacterium]|nr:PQQ-binding-like beta-propeller repeat protein [Gemmatimonadales bacterium]
YDPSSGTLYWGVGNPSPPYNGSGRAGPNLHSNSLLALDAHTGALRWHFQYMEHEQFDFDAIEIPMLLDLPGRRIIATAQRNGFYYTFDRATGRFLTGRPFAQVTWATGLDSLGKAILNPGAAPSPEGTEIYPGDGGATNWWSPSYSSGTGLFYVAVTEKPGLYYSAPAPYQKGAPYVGGDVGAVPGRASLSSIRALVPATGALAWDRVLPEPTGSLGGLLSTDGDLVLGGDEDLFYALDARNGTILWTFKTGAHIAASPVAYRAFGRQQISIVAGRDLMTFTLDGR